MREFEIAAGRAALVHDNEITYKLDGRELKAKPPTVGQLALFIQSGHDAGLRSITGMLEFLSDVTNDRDWRYIQGKLRDGLDVAVISSIVNYLIGEWSGRPTMPPIDSSPTPNGTGPSSTESAPSEESSSSDFPLTDSATSSSGG